MNLYIRDYNSTPPRYPPRVKRANKDCMGLNKAEKGVPNLGGVLL